MAIDDTGGSESDDAASGSGFSGDDVAVVGEYTWNDLRRDVHTGGRFVRSEYLGFDPATVEDRLEAGASAAKTIDQEWGELIQAERSLVVKDRYTWEHFKQEYYYNEDGSVPRDGNGEKVPFEPEEYLGFDPDETDDRIARAGDIAAELADVVDERIVDVNPELDEDAFFSTVDGHTTVVTGTTWRRPSRWRRRNTSSRRSATG